jgi:hypothetical protein
MFPVWDSISELIRHAGPADYLDHATSIIQAESAVNLVNPLWAKQWFNDPTDDESSHLAREAADRLKPGLSAPRLVGRMFYPWKDPERKRLC